MRLYVSPLRFALIVALAAFPALNASAVVFDDGLVHVIDANNSFPFEGVDVFDGPAATRTVVLMLEGGEIGSEFQQGFLFAYDSSIVSMSGGDIVGELLAEDSSEIYFSGGTISRLLARSNSTIAITEICVKNAIISAKKGGVPIGGCIVEGGGGIP